MKKVNRFNKLLSLLLSIIMIFAVIPEKLASADDVIDDSSEHIHENEIETYADEEVKPKIDIKYLGTDPVEIVEGMDFEVKYQITAHPFKHNITTPKEIVLVLDKSGSMSGTKMKNLKSAAKKFIDELTKINDKTNVPEVTNLSIGIVAYDSNGNIKSTLLQVTDDVSVKFNNITTLKDSIDNINADGGTNIGDGLRKGAYLLNNSETNANKTIIFMADGEPTYYTGSKSNKNKNYYTVLDDIDVNKSGMPYLKGTGGSDENGYCLEYAKTIGNIIRNNGYNVYSIGYGLGNSNSNSNKTMKQIHESMGGISSGDNSTFFASDSGAIESIFKKISDNLKQTYDQLDVKLDLKLGDTIVAGEGIELSDGNGAIVRIPEIIYNLGANNEYSATPATRIIKFKVKAKSNSNGIPVDLIKENSQFTYRDVNGNLITVPIPQQSITVKPYIPGDAEKLTVGFLTEFNEYLVGDTVKAEVKFNHPGTLANGNLYKNATFNIENLPEGLSFESGVSNMLTFGSIDKNMMKEYRFKINENRDYTISGAYNYDMQKGSLNPINQEGTLSQSISVRKGKVKVKVLDEQGNDITKDSIISIKSINLEEYNGVYNSDNELIEFNDNMTTGNYELTIKSLPEGCTPKEGEDNKGVMINYENNEAEHTFIVNGISESSELEIEANLVGHKPNYPYLDDDITLTYEINPKEFTKQGSEEINITDAKLVFNLGDKFSVVEGQGLVINERGEYILDFSDKVKYTYDSESNKYIANKFTVSFKVKANVAEENISFESGEVQYANILAENNPIINSAINTPSITIRNVEEVPEYDGPDIRILEIEPADSFKLTGNSNGQATTGIEPGKDSSGNNQYIIKNVNGITYKVEIVHMTMSEFIGKVNQLNGKYDVIVVGRYKNNDFKISDFGEDKLWFRDYVNLQNDITDKKAKEIGEFIDSGQLVYIDSSIKELGTSKLYKHLTSSEGYWSKNNKNLIKSKTLNLNSYDEKMTIDDIVNTYHNLTTENRNLKKPITISSKVIGDSHGDILGATYKRNMRFNIKSTNVDEDVTINLYLDINGDGIFKDEEIVKKVENVRIPERGYRLEYNFYNDYPHFIGYLDWRIEIVKPVVSGYSKPIKSYFDGNILFRRLTEEKQVINVLQISPFKRDNLNDSPNSSAANAGGNLNLATNTMFQELLKMKEVQDYEVIVEVISYEDFYQGNFKGPGHDPLNGSKYNMIIMGFADAFVEGLNQDGINQIKSFISTGQGLMLTHDTVWYKSWQNNADVRESNLFVKTFRDYIGQARYKDPNNSNELELDGSKIIHDIDRPVTNGSALSFADEAGATLAEKSNLSGYTVSGVGAQGANLTNSIEVYKTNETLLTNYPFDLGDTIRVRRTHGQYLQLNFEDDDVVPVFNLTNNNGNTTGLGSSYKNSIINKYDSRNYYYTYSRGNITFSGTGENQREAIEYPDSELRLFVNTIVKAERGANHKPQISALENVNEIPYNSNLDFNAIVKDIDGDSVRINKITVDGAAVDGYNSATSFEKQGAKFPVTIASNNFIEKINKEVKIVIEAEDSRGAVTIREYTVIPVVDALLTSKGQTIDTLVGDRVDFKIRLNRENDSNPSSIKVKNVEVPSKDGVVSLYNIATESVDGEIYLVGSLTSLVESTGEEIPMIVNYSNGSSSAKKAEVKIILNSKYATVKVTLKTSNGNAGIDPMITLNNTANNKLYEKNISLVDGIARFDSVDAGKYEMSIGETIGYDIESISINGVNTNISNNRKIEFNISFKESSKDIEIIVRPQISGLNHGLYGGITSKEVKILENSNGFEMIAGTKVTFGAKFTVGGNNFKFNLDVDSKLDDVLLNNIKVYKTVNNYGNITLDELTNINGNTVKTTEVSGKSFEISISNMGSTDSTNETEIVVIYTGAIKNNSKNDKFTNIIKFTDNKSKDAIIYTTNNGQDEIKELPDLF